MKALQTAITSLLLLFSIQTMSAQYGNNGYGNGGGYGGGDSGYGGNRMSQLNLIRFRDMMCGKIIETRLKPAFEFWKQDTKELKAVADEKQRNSAIESVIAILKNTKRGKRSPIDIEVLSKFLVGVACYAWCKKQQVSPPTCRRASLRLR